MKRILIAWLIASSIGLAETYVLPTRTDLNLVQPNYSLPFDTYTNSTTWLTGQLNGDAMTDFSPERTDAAIVGSPCLSFPASGSYLNSGVSFGDWKHREFTFEAKFNTTDPQDSVGKMFGEAAYYSEFAVYMYNGLVYVGIAGGAPVPTTNTYADGIDHTINVAYDGVSSGSFTIDGGDETTFTAGSFRGAATFSVGAVNYMGSWVQFFEGVIYEINLVFSNGEGLHYVFTESSGNKVYDVSGNDNHGTITTTALEWMWTNSTQDVNHHFANDGGVTWTNGTPSETIYVPQLADGSAPATNDVSGYTAIRTNLANAVHNRGLHSIVFGGVTNTYGMMLTNGVSVATNATGQILEYVK